MPSQQQRRRQRQIMADIAQLGLCLPGSLVARTSRCGSPSCACQTDPDRRHGPYQSWTRKINGKTVTRNLTPTQVERYRPWFDNAKRLRQLTAELEALSTIIAAEAEGWPAA
jgi:hypothetical protein